MAGRRRLHRPHFVPAGGTPRCLGTQVLLLVLAAWRRSRRRDWHLQARWLGHDLWTVEKPMRHGSHPCTADTCGHHPPASLIRSLSCGCQDELPTLPSPLHLACLASGAGGCRCHQRALRFLAHSVALCCRANLCTMCFVGSLGQLRPWHQLRERRWPHACMVRLNLSSERQLQGM